MLAAGPPITAPAITIDGLANGVMGANDGNTWKAKFRAPWQHRCINGAGHNLPQEAPRTFADTVAELAQHGKWRT